MPVNKERVMKLVERLRDPESMQARGHLRSRSNHKRMCCLGHACEVYRQETGDGGWSQTGYLLGYGTAFGWLPDKVREWYGFKSNDPEILVDGKLEWASAHNDTYKKSLAEIADGFEALCAE